MAEQPIVRSQRFFPTRLGQLVDWGSVPVQEYVRDVLTPTGLANKVIWEITYPMHLGIPDDTHCIKAFHGDNKWSKNIVLDFWQKASETATILVGDCEDSSILYVAGARNFLDPKSVYEVFGVVKDLDGNVLGGHGWAVSRLLPDDVEYRLIESTLDVPPDEYPIVPNIEKPFQMGGWVYEPQELWNDKFYKRVGTGETYARPYALRSGPKLGGVYSRGLGKKDTLAKYEALAEMWGQIPKPLKEMRKKRNALKRRVFLTYRRV